MQFVLGTVGTYIGGPIGGQIGSMIGSYIDNEFLFPVKTEGPRLEDLSVSASTYGKAIALIHGPKVRMAGNIIWATPLKETKSKRKVSGKGGPSTKVTEYTYSASVAVLLGEGEIAGIRKIWANNKLIWESDTPLMGPDTTPPSAGTATAWSALRVYPGDLAQLPDPTVQADKGVDLTPAYRGYAYVVIADMQLADFGNRIPNLEFLVVGQERATTGSIVADLIQRCGLDRNLASTLVLSDEVLGYAIGRETTGTGGIRPLATAFDFDIAEVGGAFRAQSRTSSIAAVIPMSDIGATAAAASQPDDYTWSRVPVTTLPKESAVTYSDAERDFQPNTQSQRRSEGSSDNNLSVDLAITMTADHAQKVATRLLWETWTSQQSLDTAVTDRWLSLEPGRSYLVETPAGWEPLRLSKSTRGANGIQRITLVRDRAEVYSSPVGGAHAPTPPQEVVQPGVSELILLDLPLLLDADQPKEAGFYLGVLAPSKGWRGAEVMRSSTQTGVYDPIAQTGYDLVAGWVEEPTPAPAAGYDSATDFDDVTVIRVQLVRDDMSLSSVTDADLISGLNGLYLGPRGGQGGEVLQFGVATFVSPGVYDLSHLKRGQRGTEFAWTHPADSFAVLLEQAALARVDFGYGAVGQPAWFKAVSILTNEQDSVAFQWTNGGSGLRPYSPVDLDLDGSTGGDLELLWTRRSRIGQGIEPPPLGEEFERYLVEIRNAAGTSTVRSVEVADVQSFTYTTAMQTLDFGGPVSSLRWRVAQISAAYGPGTFANWSGAV